MKGLIVIPELPEVENVRMSLEKKITGKKIINATINHNGGLSQNAIKRIFRKQDPEMIIERVVGARFSDINRRAKHLIAVIYKDDMEDEMYITVHLGMAGAWLAAEKEEDIAEKFRKHIHVKFTLEDGSILVFSDIRRHGGFSVHTFEEFRELKNISELGPEPFWDNAQNIFLKNIRKKMYKKSKKLGRTVPIFIKEAIMNQKIVSGVGNIYADESLRRVRLNPFTPVAELSDEQLIDLFEKFRDIMAFSITVGGSSVSDYVNGEGMMGSFQNYLKVYKQKQCECGAKIVRVDKYNEEKIRTTHYCPSCQK